jgi:DNA-binding transcriptional LysR family regulator
MQLTRILAFHRVAAAGSFSQAARLAGVSQPTLSAQVKDLELACGRALFERRGRRIRLTPAGEALFAATRRLAEAIDGVENVLKESGAPVRGRLRVSADSAVHVIPILAALKRGSTGLTFSLTIDNSPGVIARVLNEEADVGVTARVPTDPRLFADRLRIDRLAMLMPRTDAPAGLRSYPLADLAGRSVVLRERGSITRSTVEDAAKRLGVRPGQVMEVETREAVREAVAAGFGLGVVFASEAGDDQRLVAVPIGPPELSVAEYAVALAERRALGLVGRFMETSRQVASDLGWS